MMQIKKEIEEANKILKEIAEALDTEDWEHRFFSGWKMTE